MNESINNNHIIKYLRSGIVHIWTASLDCTQREGLSFYNILSCEEKLRANRFWSPQDQQRYIAMHGILRKLLAFYLNEDPTKLQIQQPPFVKPHLQSHPEISFTISSSNYLGVFAFTRCDSIGVDVEHIKELQHKKTLAEICLSTEEKQRYDRNLNTLDEYKFFKYWTRKEALVKGTGTGLSYPVNQITVSLEKEQIIELKNTPIGVARAWSLYELTMPTMYTGALATEKSVHELRYYLWPACLATPHFHKVQT